MPTIAEIPWRKIFFSHFQWSNWEFHWRDLFFGIIIDCRTWRHEIMTGTRVNWVKCVCRCVMKTLWKFLQAFIVHWEKAELGQATMATSTGSNECCFPCFSSSFFLLASSSTCAFCTSSMTNKCLHLIMSNYWLFFFFFASQFH